MARTKQNQRKKTMSAAKSQSKNDQSRDQLTAATAVADSKTIVSSHAIDSTGTKLNEEALDVFIVQEKSVPFETYQKEGTVIVDLFTAEGKPEEEEVADVGKDEDGDDDGDHEKDDGKDEDDKKDGSENGNPTKKQKLH